MFSVLERNETTLIRDRSSFIGILLHISDVSLLNQYLADIKKEYPKAKHYCYAYIIGDKKKGFDDGEPSKTAGRPLLELLEKKKMDEVLLVVVRYFGGVLLGASRLMSTYLESGVQTIETADLVSIENKYIYHLELSYKDFDELKRFSRKYTISLENVLYEDKISVDAVADLSAGELLANAFPNIKIEVFGTKKVYRSCSV